MNVRIEVRYRQSWDQPVVIVHPDPEHARALAKVIVDALRDNLRLPVRATVGDNPPESGVWGEGEVVYARG